MKMYMGSKKKVNTLKESSPLVEEYDPLKGTMKIETATSGDNSTTIHRRAHGDHEHRSWYICDSASAMPNIADVSLHTTKSVGSDAGHENLSP
jgi:hypothetical protein